MAITRRRVVSAALAAPAVIAAARLGVAAPLQVLNISHQFPGGTIDRGDFRDRLCRKFAQELWTRSNGALAGRVYPESTLVKTVQQFAAMRRTSLDMSLYPLTYAGDQFPELNIGLMPGLVASYQESAAWKTGRVGDLLRNFLNEKGIIIISWIWQAGGVASRDVPIVGPEDARGLCVRGGSREMDAVLRAAGATTLSTSSNEIFAAMQAGACSAAITSSTSLISFRLEELAKHLTTGRGKAYWYMFEPLLMAKSTFNALSKPHRDLVMAIGLEMERFGMMSAKFDDDAVADVYAKKGATIHDLDDAAVRKWRSLARETVWKTYAAQSAMSAELIRAALEIHAA